MAAGGFLTAERMAEELLSGAMSCISKSAIRCRFICHFRQQRIAYSGGKDTKIYNIVETELICRGGKPKAQTASWRRSSKLNILISGLIMHGGEGW